MKNLMLPVAALLFLSGAALAQLPCSLSLDKAPAIRTFRLGMPVAEAVSAEPKLLGHIAESGRGSQNFKVDNTAVWLNFENGKLYNLAIRYPGSKYSQIDDFTARLSADMKLPDAWVSATAEQLAAEKRRYEIIDELKKIDAEEALAIKTHGKDHAEVALIGGRKAALIRERARMEPVGFDGKWMQCRDFAVQAIIPSDDGIPTFYVTTQKLAFITFAELDSKEKGK